MRDIVTSHLVYALAIVASEAVARLGCCSGSLRLCPVTIILYTSRIRDVKVHTVLTRGNQNEMQHRQC